jgi:hypothetical protein
MIIVESPSGPALVVTVQETGSNLAAGPISALSAAGFLDTIAVR